MKFSIIISQLHPPNMVAIPEIAEKILLNHHQQIQ